MDSTRKRILGLVSAAFLTIFVNGDCSPLDCGSSSTGSGGGGGGGTAKSGIVISDTANNRAAFVADIDGTGWQVTNTDLNPPSIRPLRVAIDHLGRIYYTQDLTDYIVRIDDIEGHGQVTFGNSGSGTGQLNRPKGIAIDSAGRIYIVDSANNRVVRVNDMSGAGWTEFGSLGGGVGKFSRPAGITLDSSGRIYVADAGNGRIVQMADMSGAGWTSYSSFDLVEPRDIAVDPVRGIFIAEASRNKIVHIDDLSGIGLSTFGSFGNSTNQFDQPSGIALDSAGRLYIADQENKRCVRIDNMTGAGWTELSGSWPNAGAFGLLHCVTVSPTGRIFTADLGRVASFADIAGSDWKSFSGLPTPKLNQPSGVALDRKDGFYLADTENNRIAYYPTVDQLTPIYFGKDGNGPRQFRRPRGVAVDFLGRIYVADTGNNRIVRMDDFEGNGFVAFGMMGNGAGQFNAPTGIAVTQVGAVGTRIYIADSVNHRIVRIDDMNGNGWVSLGSQGSGVRQFNLPTGVSVLEDGPKGGIYVADTLNDRIVYSRDMTGDGWVRILGSGPSKFRSPTAVSIGRVTRLIRVADQGNHRIVQFDGFSVGAGSGGPVGSPQNLKTLGTPGTGEKQFQNPWGVDGT